MMEYLQNPKEVLSIAKEAGKLIVEDAIGKLYSMVDDAMDVWGEE